MNKPKLAAAIANDPQHDALERYLENQKLLAVARDRGAEIQLKIDESESAERDELEKMPSEESLNRSLESCAAARAMGQITENEAANNRTYIAEQRKLLDEAKARVETVRQTRVGLERLHGTAQQEIQSLEAKERELLGEFLLAESEAAGESYLRAAKEMIGYFLRLLYLREIMGASHSSSVRNMLYQNVREISVPSFSVKACEGLLDRRWPGVLYNFERLHMERVFDEANATEENRLRELGIALPDVPTVDDLKSWFRAPFKRE